VSGLPALKTFHRPRLWLGLWLVAVLAVVVLSLVNLSGLPPVPEGGDKVEHFLAYALLSAAAVQIFRERRTCVAVAFALVGMGIGLEFAQGLLTTTRLGDPRDALANTLGVIAGLSTAFTPLRHLLQTLEVRFMPVRS
jgi:VanZ family protein